MLSVSSTTSDIVVNLTETIADINPSPTDSAMVGAAVAAEKASLKRAHTPTSSLSTCGAKARKKKKFDLEEQEFYFMQSFVEANRRKAEGQVGDPEKKRHARRMQEMEENKTNWQAKKEELSYKRELLSLKRELECDGKTEQEIVALFPELEMFYK